MAEPNAATAPAVPPAASGTPPAAAAARPAFDIVRVEPTGESVIAGRAAPNAAVELLRDGAVHDRTVADTSGGFAFVAPPLPPGASEVSLRMSGAGGTAVLSEQSVTVVVAPRRDERPVVALAAPGQPTAILSTPEPVTTAASGAPPTRTLHRGRTG